MFCRYCSKELPDDSRFCLNCGKPVSDKAEVQPTQYETCSITWWDAWAPLALNYRFQFEAKATGPKGYYKVAESSIVTERLFIGGDANLQHNEGRASVNAALNELVLKLTSDDWEVTGRGTYWWDHRFRRPVR